jgi:hypothetical protein
MHGSRTLRTAICYSVHSTAGPFELNTTFLAGQHSQYRAQINPIPASKTVGHCWYIYIDHIHLDCSWQVLWFRCQGFSGCQPANHWEPSQCGFGCARVERLPVSVASLLAHELLMWTQLCATHRHPELRTSTTGVPSPPHMSCHLKHLLSCDPPCMPPGNQWYAHMHTSHFSFQ